MLSDSVDKIYLHIMQFCTSAPTTTTLPSSRTFLHNNKVFGEEAVNKMKASTTGN